MTLHLRTRPILITLVGTIFVLAILGALAGWSTWLAPSPRFHGLEPVFDLAGENNVPTWFSTVLLTGAAITISLVAWRAGRVGDPEAPNVWRWWALAVGVAFISLLEDASLFERAIAFTAAGRRFEVPQWFWRTAGLAVVTSAAFVYAPLLVGRPRGRAALFALSAVVMLGGHAAFARLGGWMFWHGGVHQAGFVFARVAEETCKMLGTVMLLSATLSELREGGEVRVRVE
ncbi:MAG: hypothetical protein HZA61_00485 [Candidatus Eisenbacteria bacterium]|uniref:Uncharacterized protein n=1 Tax=Eiseniibacteriota bacterium TaxID=2212470 RepID=A0A933SA87_UNCEI|nr:hypothetical protein [Candidatus Eisenbacteria bacterium]